MGLEFIATTSNVHTTSVTITTAITTATPTATPTAIATITLHTITSIAFEAIRALCEVTASPNLHLTLTLASRSRLYGRFVRSPPAVCPLWRQVWRLTKRWRAVVVTVMVLVPGATMRGVMVVVDGGILHPLTLSLLTLGPLTSGYCSGE